MALYMKQISEHCEGSEKKERPAMDFETLKRPYGKFLSFSF